jgi:hypothetical protein
MNLPFAMSLPEKIATVMLSRKSGNLGTFRDMSHGRYIVDVDGTRAIISGNARGWVVSIVGRCRAIVNDRDLETALRDALALTVK